MEDSECLFCSPPQWIESIRSFVLAFTPPVLDNRILHGNERLETVNVPTFRCPIGYF